LTRAGWRAIARGLLENVLQYTGGLEQPLALPASPAAGYPRLNALGRPIGERPAYAEAFARTLLLAAPLLKDDPGLTLDGKRVADYYRHFLVAGTRDRGPETFGFPRGTIGGQQVVEAALITIALRTAPGALWRPLSAVEQTEVIRWLEPLAARPVHPNNWQWFTILLNTFLTLEGAAPPPGRVRQALNVVRSMYVDAGWFRDGDAFDFYSAWVMQLYPLIWAEWDGASYPDIRDEFYRRNDEFLESYPHVFSRTGHMPPWGRSLCYRFAASAALAVSFRRPGHPAIDPGFARRLCSGNLLQFISRRDTMKDGLLALGFYGEEPPSIDAYSSVASPYWSSKLFLALTLPEHSPFWSARENEGFWDNPPSRFEFGRTGMWSEHDSATGDTRLYAPQAARPDDPRYHAPFYRAGGRNHPTDDSEDAPPIPSHDRTMRSAT
jgi:hypothetical protein